jgi:hypothetical protein
MRNPTAAALAAISTIALGDAAPAQAPGSPLDGHYRGTLVCEQLPGARGILHAPLDIRVSGTIVIFARPLFNAEGSQVLGSEMASGTLDGGNVRLTSNGDSNGARYEGTYSGTISTSGGTLSGTQTWTVAMGSRTRACHAAFVKVRI